MEAIANCDVKGLEFMEQISLCKGDKVLVLEKCHPSWRAQSGGKTGYINPYSVTMEEVSYFYKGPFSAKRALKNDGNFVIFPSIIPDDLEFMFRINQTNIKYRIHNMAPGSFICMGYSFTSVNDLVNKMCRNNLFDVRKCNTSKENEHVMDILGSLENEELASLDERMIDKFNNESKLETPKEFYFTKEYFQSNNKWKQRYFNHVERMEEFSLLDLDIMDNRITVRNLESAKQAFEEVESITQKVMTCSDANDIDKNDTKKCKQNAGRIASYSLSDIKDTIDYNHIKNVAEEIVYSFRNEVFKRKVKSSGDHSHGYSNLYDPFNNDTIQFLHDELFKIFKHDYSKDYIETVLVNECIIKLYSTITNVGLKEAEKLILLTMQNEVDLSSDNIEGNACVDEMDSINEENMNNDQVDLIEIPGSDDNSFAKPEQKSDEKEALLWAAKEFSEASLQLDGETCEDVILVPPTLELQCGFASQNVENIIHTILPTRCWGQTFWRIPGNMSIVEMQCVAGVLRNVAEGQNVEEAIEYLKEVKSRVVTEVADESVTNNICQGSTPEDIYMEQFNGSTEARSLACTKCQKTFDAPVLLKRHINMVHKQAKYCCKYCSKTYLGISELKKHIEKNHIDSRKRAKQSTLNLLSDVFDETAEWQTIKETYLSLSKHEMRKLYFCGQTFTTVSNLNPVNTTVIGSKVFLFNGDVTRLEVDGLINWTNSTFNSGTEIERQVIKAAGPNLMEEIKTLNLCPEGEIRMTSGYKLPSRHILFAVEPLTETPYNHMRTYRNALKIAVENKMQSIAFPCIQSVGYPKKAAAELAIRTVKRFLQRENESRILKHVIFVVRERKHMDIYNDRLNYAFPC